MIEIINKIVEIYKEASGDFNFFFVKKRLSQAIDLHSDAERSF